MKQVLIIGIGVGDPDHVTMQAIAAMNRVDVFFVIDKGAAKADLMNLRTEICDRFIPKPSSYRTVEIRDPARDRDPVDYEAAVATWHQTRAEQFAAVIDRELADGEVGAFLVWGDPALYDSTLRIVEQIARQPEAGLEYEVIPGVTAVHTLAARHRIPLHRIGESALITTGRRLAALGTLTDDNVVVMLDGECAFRAIDPVGIEIFWGAYLGTADEILIAGPLEEVGPTIQRVRAEARARKGWIMDIYLLRRSRAGV